MERNRGMCPPHAANCITARGKVVERGDMKMIENTRILDVGEAVRAEDRND